MSIKDNINKMKTLLAKYIVIIYVLFGMYYIFNNKPPNQWYIVLLYFVMFKMIFNYNKCTISYIECKIRGVHKENGYLYSFLSSLINLRYTSIFLPLILYTVIFSTFYFSKGGKIIF